MGKTGASAVKAGAAYVELSTDDAKLKGGLKNAKTQMKAFAGVLTSMGRQMAVAGAAMLAPVALMVRKFGSYGDQVAKMAKRTGLSTEAVSRLSHAAQLSGTSLEGLEAGLKRMARVVLDAGQGLGEAKRSFEEIGITVDSLKGKNPEDIFIVLAEALKRIEDPTKKAALAQEIFGRAGTMLIPLFNEGADGIRRMGMEAERLGIVLSPGASARAEKFTDEMLRVKTALKGVAVTIGDALTPVIVKNTEKITAWIVKAIDWAKRNNETIVMYIKLATTITAVGLSLLVLGKTVALVMFMFTPAGALGLAIAGVLALLDSLGIVNIGFMSFVQNIRVGGHKISTWIQTAWLEILQGWERVKDHLATSWDDLVTSAKTLGSTLFRMLIWVPEKILEGFDWMIRQVVNKLNWLVEQANKLPFVDIKKILPSKIAKDAADFFKNLSKGSTDASSKEWDDFEKRRQKRAKETQAVLSSLQGAQRRIFSEDITGIKKVAVTAAAATAGAAAPSMPAMPTVPTTAEGPTTEIVGTFAGRRASQMAGAGTLERESLNTEKLMARLLAIIANNTREGGMVLG